MKIEYDPQADAMYLKLFKGKIAETKLVAKNISVDLDRRGNAVGIEILFFKKKFKRNNLFAFTTHRSSSVRKAA